MTKNYITRAELIELYPLIPRSRPGMRNWIKRQGFPAPFYLNCNHPVWSPDAVDEWFANRPTNPQDARAAAQAA
jgi:predicted DNA-binding transcriptional regulator AlpA